MTTKLNSQPPLTMIIAALCVAVLNPIHAHSDDASGELLATVAEQALQVYATDTGVDTNAASDRFVGFKASGSKENAVIETFTAEGEYDLWSQSYACKSPAEGETACERADGYPRCFYFSRARLFSVNEHLQAVRSSLEMVAAREGRVRADSMKAWQSDEYVFVRVVYADQDGKEPLKDANLGCWHLNSQLKCEFLLESGPNEP